MDYETFWAEIGPYCLVLRPRAVCDRDIAAGHVDEDTVLSVLKSMARLQLAAILMLKRGAAPV